MLCAISVIGFLTYANTFTGEFVWDDVSSIVFHQGVKDPANILQLFQEDQHAYGRGQGNFYRPLVAVSFMLDYQLAAASTDTPDAPSVLIFHLSSVAWHVAAALFLFALMTRLNAPTAVRVVVPLLYVIHPLHTEAVAYMSGRADSMSATFIFAGLCAGLWQPTALKKRIGALMLMAFLFACGLVSKESSFIFPVLLLLCVLLRDSRHGETSLMTRFLPIAAAVVLLGIYGVLRTTVLSFASETASSAPTAPLGERIVETVQSFAYYLALLVNPTHLHMERTLNNASSATTMLGLLGLVTCAILLVFSIIKKQRRAALGIMWFIAAWAPISGLFPLNAPMAEHWMYVPMAGLFWALAELFLPRTDHPWSPLQNRPLIALATLLVVVFGLSLLAQSVERNYDWRSNESLFRSTLRENPDTSRVHFNLAVTYEDVLGNPPGARRHYEEVLRVSEQRRQASPDLGDFHWDQEVEAYFSLGNIAYLEDDLRTAAHYYQKTLRMPVHDGTRNSIALAAAQLGQIYLTIGNPQKAQSMFDHAITLVPELAPKLTPLLQG